MSTNNSQEDPSLSGLLRPLGKKKVQVIKMVVRIGLGVVILIVVIILLYFIIASHL